MFLMQPPGAAMLSGPGHFFIHPFGGVGYAASPPMMGPSYERLSLLCALAENYGPTLEDSVKENTMMTPQPLFHLQAPRTPIKPLVAFKLPVVKQEPMYARPAPHRPKSPRANAHACQARIVHGSSTC